MATSDQSTLKYYIQKYNLALILLSVPLVLLGASETFLYSDPGFGVFMGVPGILLLMLVFLTKPKRLSGQSNILNMDTSPADELLKWHALKEKDIITEAEFQKKRDELLGFND